jgi:hypothetical protein
MINIVNYLDYVATAVHGGNCKLTFDPPSDNVKSFSQYAYWDDSLGYEVHNQYFADNQCSPAGLVGDEVIYSAYICDDYNSATKSPEEPEVHGLVAAQYLGSRCPNNDEEFSIENSLFKQTSVPLHKCIADLDAGASYFLVDCYNKKNGGIKGDYIVFSKSTHCTGRSRVYQDQLLIPSSSICTYMDGQYSFWLNSCEKP